MLRSYYTISAFSSNVSSSYTVVCHDDICENALFQKFLRNILESRDIISSLWTGLPPRKDYAS
jgi:hypothetical protein